MTAAATANRETTRFAPSPSGYLHLGHAYSALFTAQAARATGGRFLLRIDDIDTDRARPAFEAAIFEDLAWLGLSWEEPPRRQSTCMADYAQALERLKAEGATREHQEGLQMEDSESRRWKGPSG